MFCGQENDLQPYNVFLLWKKMHIYFTFCFSPLQSNKHRIICKIYFGGSYQGHCCIVKLLWRFVKSTLEIALERMLYCISTLEVFANQNDIVRKEVPLRHFFGYSFRVSINWVSRGSWESWRPCQAKKVLEGAYGSQGYSFTVWPKQEV